MLNASKCATCVNPDCHKQSRIVSLAMHEDVKLGVLECSKCEERTGLKTMCWIRDFVEETTGITFVLYDCKKNLHPIIRRKDEKAPICRGYCR